MAVPAYFQGSSMTYLSGGNNNHNHNNHDAESRGPTMTTPNVPLLPPSYETAIANTNETKIANGSYGKLLSPNNNHHFADLCLNSNGDCRTGNGYGNFASDTNSPQRFVVPSAPPPPKPQRLHLQQFATERTSTQETSPLVNGDLAEHDESKNAV